MGDWWSWAPLRTLHSLAERLFAPLETFLKRVSKIRRWFGGSDFGLEERALSLGLAPESLADPLRGCGAFRLGSEPARHGYNCTGSTSWVMWKYLYSDRALMLEALISITQMINQAGTDRQMSSNPVRLQPWSSGPSNRYGVFIRRFAGLCGRCMSCGCR